MDEQIKVVEQTEVEEQQVTDETPEEEQGNGIGIIDTIFTLGTLAAVGVGAFFGGRFLCRKHAGKVQRDRERKIADLEKAGYVIIRPETEEAETETETEAK
jgi:hypothetical protein